MKQKELRKNKIPGLISCDQATFLISKKKDAELNFFEKIPLGIHLFVCKNCRRYNKQIEIIDQTLGFIREKTNKKLTKQEKEEMQKFILQINKKNQADK